MPEPQVLLFEFQASFDPWYNDAPNIYPRPLLAPVESVEVRNRDAFSGGDSLMLGHAAWQGLG